ncbi:putative ribokinase [Coemansia sp. Benny D115]|nr:putative ribokinase [Coemansia sp. Benny D115]
MQPKIVSFASINIDEVYSISHIVLPGETLSTSARQLNAGGKGTNASIAAARAATTPVYVAGKIGNDGLWVRDIIQATGANTTHITVDPQVSTGRAIIQVDVKGENAIFLYPGANHRLTEQDARNALAQCNEGDWLLLTNETTAVVEAIMVAKERGMQVLWNPAPMDTDLVARNEQIVSQVDVLVVNETELADLVALEQDVENQQQKTSDVVQMARQAMRQMKHCRVIAVTLGSRGSLCLVRRNRRNSHTIPVGTQDTKNNIDIASLEPSTTVNEDIVEIQMDCAPVDKDMVRDTTGAGDTWVGYFVAELARAQGDSAESISSTLVTLTPAMVTQAMRVASYASGITVTRLGAVPSIPERRQVEEFLRTNKL